MKKIAFIPTSFKIKIKVKKKNHQEICWDLVYQNVQLITLQNLKVYSVRNVILLVRNVFNLLLLLNVLLAIQTLLSINIYSLKAVLHIMVLVWLPVVHLMEFFHHHHPIKLSVQNMIVVVCNANLQKIQLHVLSVLISLVLLMTQANN